MPGRKFIARKWLTRNALFTSAERRSAGPVRQQACPLAFRLVKMFRIDRKIIERKYVDAISDFLSGGLQKIYSEGDDL